VSVDVSLTCVTCAFADTQGVSKQHTIKNKAKDSISFVFNSDAFFLVHCDVDILLFFTNIGI
jgi:hypothetical protein